MINDELRFNGYDLEEGTNVTNTKYTPILKKIATDLVFMFFQQARNAKNRGVTDNVTGFWQMTPELTFEHKKKLRRIAKQLNGAETAYNYNSKDGLS
jgi:hypothetical protein